MKNDNGGTKTIFIAVISILIIALVAILVVFKFKGSNNNNGNNGGSTGYTENMSFIESNDNEYVFIDTNCNVRKLKKDSIGNISSMNEGEVLYKNSMLAKKDGKASIIDFNGKTLYGPAEVELLTNSKEAVLYQFRDNHKYGVLNEKGEVIVEAKYESDFSMVSPNLNSFFYVIDDSSTSSGSEINIFDKDGKNVYTGPIGTDTLFGNKCGKTRTGINLLAMRKSTTSIVVVNMNTGDEIATLTDNNDHVFDIVIKGNVAVISSYKQGPYGADEGDRVTRYVWFDENGKISKALDLKENESLGFWNGSDSEDYTIYKNASREEIAIDKYGKEVYKSSGSLSQIYYTNEITKKTNSLIIESQGGKKYSTINSEGKVILEGQAKKIGNKYVLVGKTLYNLDGTKYMDDVKKYTSIYDLDIIKTEDKTIIENQDGKSVEKEADFDLGKEYRLLNDNTVVLLQNKKLKIVNMTDLSIKDLDFSDATYVFIKEGYIYVSNKNSEVDYYNENGDKIYTRKK